MKSNNVFYIIFSVPCYITVTLNKIRKKLHKYYIELFVKQWMTPVQSRLLHNTGLVKQVLEDVSSNVTPCKLWTKYYYPCSVCWLQKTTNIYHTLLPYIYHTLLPYIYFTNMVSKAEKITHYTYNALDWKLQKKSLSQLTL